MMELHKAIALLALAILPLAIRAALERGPPRPAEAPAGHVDAKVGDRRVASLRYDTFLRRVHARCARARAEDDRLVPVRFYNWDRDGQKEKIRSVIMCPIPQREDGEVTFEGNAQAVEFAVGGASDIGDLPPAE